jgi:cephalosporin-C deacetylase-like acetyl esterase
MRSLCWCSAVLVLAACGTGGHARDPFAYRHTPLAVRDAGVVLSGPRTVVHDVSYAGESGSRVLGFLLVPRAAGRHPAVLFLHGSGGTREDLLVPAAVLANRGFVTLTISQPNDTETYRPLVVNARRALDLLAARRDVDTHRLGVVGFSLGAQVAAILAGDDRRPRAVDVIGGRANDVTLYWIRRANAHLLFQAGLHDQVVPHAQLFALMNAAPDHPQVRWYDTEHDVSPQIEHDLDAFILHTLG